MRSQERQLVAVRLTILALAAPALVAFGERGARGGAYVLIGAVVVYTLLLWWLSNRFPAREVGIVATALDMAAVTVAVYIQPARSTPTCSTGSSCSAAPCGSASAHRSGLRSCAPGCTPPWCSSAPMRGPARSLLPVRLVYLIGIGLAGRPLRPRRAWVGPRRSRAAHAARPGGARAHPRPRGGAPLRSSLTSSPRNLDREATVGTIVRSTAEPDGRPRRAVARRRGRRPPRAC